MTLVFNRLIEVIKVHVHAKFHQVQQFTNYRLNREKNLATTLKTILPSLPRAVINNSLLVLSVPLPEVMRLDGLKQSSDEFQIMLTDIILRHTKLAYVFL